MKLTTLFRLRKPDGTDPVNIEDFNDNFDVIDEELGKRLESTGSASDMTTAFTQASTRTNLKTGEKISASFGKIMKWFADLKAVAFSGSYNDLSNKPSIPSGAAASQAVANNCTTTAAGSVLDARQGKVLMDKTNQLSSEMIWKDLGMVVGPEKLVLPSVFRELWITIAPLGTSATRYTLYIIYDNLPELESEYKRYRTGYAANANDITGVSVMISKKDAYIEDLFSAGDNYTDTACMRIFYR